jgi:hypothetical protein
MLGLGALELGASSDFEVDPELEIIPSTAGSHSPVRRILASSLAAGGAATWLVMEQP